MLGNESIFYYTCSNYFAISTAYIIIIGHIVVSAHFPDREIFSGLLSKQWWKDGIVVNDHFAVSFSSICSRYNDYIATHNEVIFLIIIVNDSYIYTSIANNKLAVSRSAVTQSTCNYVYQLAKLI